MAVVSIRLDDDLLERVDEYADRAGVKRSAAVRMLLKTSLGDPMTESATRQALLTVYGQMRALIEDEAREMLARLENRISELNQPG